LCAAIASKILGNEKEITNTNSCVTFTHMKPQIQNWEIAPDKWTSVLGKYYRNDDKLMLGNFLQSGMLHYVESEFLSDEMLGRIENATNVS
jgi:hypothetical protein